MKISAASTFLLAPLLFVGTAVAQNPVTGQGGSVGQAPATTRQNSTAGDAVGQGPHSDNNVNNGTTHSQIPDRRHDQLNNAVGALATSIPTPARDLNSRATPAASPTVRNPNAVQTIAGGSGTPTIQSATTTQGMPR